MMGGAESGTKKGSLPISNGKTIDTRMI